MGQHNPRNWAGSARLRLSVAIMLPMLFVLLGSTAAAASSRHLPAPHHNQPSVTCLLPGGSRSGAGHECVEHHLPGVAWSRWCRHRVRCAAHHLYLHPHFGLGGPVGRQLKPLPEGKWVRRFVRVGWEYHLSPRILMAIGLIESYGGTTSAAYMGVPASGHL